MLPAWMAALVVGSTSRVVAVLPATVRAAVTATPPYGSGSDPDCAARIFFWSEPAARASCNFPQLRKRSDTVASSSWRTCSCTAAGAPERNGVILLDDLRAKSSTQPKSIHGADGLSGSKPEACDGSKSVGIALMRSTGAK